jgi:signal transduction histidine kinase
VPLVHRNRAIGVLNVFYPRGRQPGEREIAYLAAIADHAAVVAESARVFADAREKAVLEERQRLARELHDSVSQALYGIALGARTARALVDREPSQAIEPLDYVLSLAEAALTEMRALIFELRPETLESEGLVAALTKQIESAQARHGLEVKADMGEEPALPYEAKEALYRIAQEALNNVVKHARARRIDLHLSSSAHGTILEVGDDGVGFASNGAVPGHLGLQSMRERAARVGGELDVESAPARGTRVRARIPAPISARGDAAHLESGSVSGVPAQQT